MLAEHPNKTTFSISKLLISCLTVACFCFGCHSSDDSRFERASADRQPSDRGETDNLPLAEPPLPRENQSANKPVAQRPTSRAAKLGQAERLIEQQKFADAAVILQSLLTASPEDVELLFRLANVKAALGDLPLAIELLAAIPEDHPEAGIPALGQAADWCFRLQRYADAERLYLKVLERAPSASLARRQLAYLLNRQGRRHEAAVHIQQLCKLGNVRQDELHSLIVLSDAMYDEPGAKRKTSDRPYFPIGPLAVARKLFNQQKYTEAVDAMQAEAEDGDATPALMAFYGRAAAEAQDDDRFQWWLARTNEATKNFSEYWAALGTHLMARRRYDEAARALLEAIDRDPTDSISIGRLRQAMLTLGDEQSAKQWEDRWNDIRETLRVNNRIAGAPTPDPDAVAELAARLNKLNRPLEAVMWKSIEVLHRGLPKTEMVKLNTQRQELVAAGKAFPSRSNRLCGIDPGKYPLPKLDMQPVEVVKSVPGDTIASPHAAAFENVAQRVGLSHTFEVASGPQDSGFTIYQLLGGGVAVLDFDRDGSCDLYLAQGAADPPSLTGDQSNQFMRHAEGRLVDISDSAQTAEYQYTLTVTAGDWNQDGFSDLAVANLGTDSLLINNGDGTFTRRPVIHGESPHRVPSSMAMADLSGDGLPDLFQASYVDDPAFAKKPATNSKGQVLQALLPTAFQPGGDRLLVNNGSGGFRLQALTDDTDDISTGLGVVVTDFDQQPGNEIFVGNDLRPNQLWFRDRQSGRWSDAAPLLGCGFGFTGKATASMGIAAGDFDGGGSIDLHVTNYEKENASLFIHKDGAYQDRNIEYQLAQASHPVLGFGTQAIDYDNDGRLDLVVANGHIERAVMIESPFEQPPQLFANLGDRFQLASVSDPSGYWQGKHVGRGLARLDFNRDGRIDYVVTHLGHPSALLINQTKTDNHWLQLELVGTSSERDAIGARVEISYGRQATGWVTAGDGYFSRNEAVVSFGLGTSDTVDELIIDWPSGKQQTFKDVPADNRLMIIEGQENTFALLNSP